MKHCRCGHDRAEHTHHRRGTDCTTCGISCLRYRPARAVGWIVAVFVMAAILLAAGFALAVTLAVNGWWLFAVWTLVGFAAASVYYKGVGYDLLAEHRAAMVRLDRNAHLQRRRHLAAVARHPSSTGARRQDWDRALVELIADHHRRAA